MKYVGFGCSWMYGSELSEIGDNWHEIERNQHDRTFLGLLGEYENISWPGNSNPIMFQQFTEWFRACENFDDIMVIFALTDAGRAGFYDKDEDKWVSTQWINPGDKFHDSYKEYLAYTSSEKYEKISHANVVLSVSSICKAHGIKYVIFNALKLPEHTIKVDNYFWQGTSMYQQLLEKDKQKYLHEFEHPTEEGHKWIAGRVKEFIDTAYPDLL